jgi:hypothetical protein
MLAIFSSCVRIEGVHTLQFGVVRRKSRVQRRYGMPLVHPLIFYPWRAYDFWKAMAQWGLIFWRAQRLPAAVAHDEAGAAILDVAGVAKSGAAGLALLPHDEADQERSSGDELFR